MVEIRDFVFEDELLEPFIDLPWRLYADDPRWVPPVRGEVGRLLSPQNRFFEYGRIRNFLALDGDRAVGRCAAFVNPRLEHDGEPVGLVGFFEVEDELEVSRALLEAARSWLAAEGRQRVWGPIDFSIWHHYRLMTRGFDREPFQGEPYNPPYYPEHFRALGFEPLASYYSWDLDRSDLERMRAFARAGAQATAEMTKDFETRPIDIDHFDQELVRLHELHNDAFSENLAFTPLTLEEFCDLYGSLGLFMTSSLAQLVVDSDGRVVGAAVGFPDLAPILRREDGRIDDPAVLAEAKNQQGARVIINTIVLREEVRKQGLVAKIAANGLDYLFEQLDPQQAVGALAKEGPTIYDKTGESTREYTLFEYRGG